MPQIGFVQGRLSPLINGRIQAFPVAYWLDELSHASKHNFTLIEWTVDYLTFQKNALLIDFDSCAHALRKNGLRVNSLTCDFIMEKPFYRCKKSEKDRLLHDLRQVIHSTGKLKQNTILVIPLVDNGALKNKNEENIVLSVVESLYPLLKHYGLKIAFESNYPPERLRTFIMRFNSTFVGVNYDMGNSASLGFCAKNEIKCYGEHIINVHVKDKLHKGVSVPLGKGDVDFNAVFSTLKDVGYQGDFILQTARCTDSQHAEALVKYRDLISTYLNNYF